MPALSPCLQPYTVRTWTLRMDEDDMVWEMDGVLDAAELWALDGYKGLPHTSSWNTPS